MRPKFLGFKQHSTANCPSLESSYNQSCQRSKSSRGILSSQSNPFQHRSRRIAFAGRINRATNPRAYELMTERIPLPVGGRSFTTILKRKVSDWTSHWMARARSTGKLSESSSLTDPALSDTGTDWITS